MALSGGYAGFGELRAAGCAARSALEGTRRPVPGIAPSRVLTVVLDQARPDTIERYGPGLGSRDSRREIRLVDVLLTILTTMGIDFDDDDLYGEAVKLKGFGDRDD